MSLEVDDVTAWLLELHQTKAAALLSEAQFEYTYIDTAFRLDALDVATDIMELSIRVPPRIYRTLRESKNEAEQIEAAISELTQHTPGSHIRGTTWTLKLPTLAEVSAEPDTGEIYSDSSLYDVQRLWTKAKARILNDPGGAITAARTMLESLCKLIINENGHVFTNREDLPQLYGKAVSLIGSSTGKQSDEEYRRLAGSCASIMNAITTIRNREGNSHARSQNVATLHAKFVVNVAGSLVNFLVGLRQQPPAQATDERLSTLSDDLLSPVLALRFRLRSARHSCCNWSY